MIDAFLRLWYRCFPPKQQFTEEELREMLNEVYAEFQQKQTNLVEPLLKAMEKHKEDA